MAATDLGYTMTAMDRTAARRRDRAIVVIAILVMTVLAWAYILWFAAQMGMVEGAAAGTAEGAMVPAHVPGGSGTMSGMDMGSGVGAAVQPAFRPWGVADFAFMFTMWAVMMAGMMTPRSEERRVGKECKSGRA